MLEDLSRCEGHPNCDRWTTSLYCCHPCDLATRDGWDIRGQHSPGCDARHADRVAANAGR